MAVRQVGWRVTVLERAARFGEIGAGITLLSNGLRCLDADLVVGADGVHSWIRAQRWPDAPAPVYSGSTTWREPIPTVLAHTPPKAVLRHDIYRLPKLDSYCRGSVVLLGDAAHAMTPNLGQGGGQALEDAIVLAAAVSRTSNVAAALSQYDHERQARTQAMCRVATRQLRFGQQLHSPIPVAVRNTAVALTPNRIALLAIARYGRWFRPRSTTRAKEVPGCRAAARAGAAPQRPRQSNLREDRRQRPP